MLFEFRVQQFKHPQITLITLIQTGQSENLLMLFAPNL